MVGSMRAPALRGLPEARAGVCLWGSAGCVLVRCGAREEGRKRRGVYVCGEAVARWRTAMRGAAVPRGGNSGSVLCRADTAPLRRAAVPPTAPAARLAASSVPHCAQRRRRMAAGHAVHAVPRQWSGARPWLRWHIRLFSCVFGLKVHVETPHVLLEGLAEFRRQPC